MNTRTSAIIGFGSSVPPATKQSSRSYATRETRTIAPLHYFSHYEASKAYAADCELRVGGITEREITEKAIQSRDQKLKFFITTLQTIIHDDFDRHLPSDPRWTASQFHGFASKVGLCVDLWGKRHFCPNSHYQTLTVLEGFGFNREVLSVGAFCSRQRSRCAAHR